MIGSYFTDTVFLVTKTTDDWGHGTETVTPGVSCRVEWKTRMIHNMAGEEVTSLGTVTFAPDQALDNTVRVRISGKDYLILAITEKKDFAIRCKEAYLGG